MVQPNAAQLESERCESAHRPPVHEQVARADLHSQERFTPVSPNFANQSITIRAASVNFLNRPFKVKDTGSELSIGTLDIALA